MARCEGTTRDGDQCKREARPDSQFCYLHGPKPGSEGNGGEATAEDELDFAELAPILLAGVLAAGLVFLLKGFGKWIPKL
ncbi:MAG: hypothetical protein HKO65_18605 [Gemmatimonadetes bacterium]|nr:hypothetical protein [Gemmatimonadota bacterium]NNM07110.1 hypothetical protein [Gemmatimonadota bacterium]